jgi:hypothetical protein
MPLGECSGPEEEHRPHQLVRERISQSSAVRSKQVVLECFALGASDVSRGESAKTGCDAVDDVGRIERVVDNLSGRGETLRQVVRHRHVCPAIGDLDNLLWGNRVSADDDSAHGVGR